MTLKSIIILIGSLLFLFIALLPRPGLTIDPIEFTPEEQEWIASHPVIRVANEMDWPPFDYNENGTPKGLAIDHILLLAEKAGIEIEFTFGKSWKELVYLFRNKEIDVMPVFYMNKERESFTLFTKPYHIGRLGVLVTEGNHFDIQNLQGLRVAMESSHGSIPLIQRKYPNITIIEIDKKEDLVKKLATGQLDIIIGNPFVFYHHARINQIESLQLVDYIEFDDQDKSSVSFHVGVRKDWPLLHQILEKSMDHVTEKQMSVLMRKWADIQIVRKIDWILIAQVTAAILCIFTFLLWHNKRLKTLVDKRTKELHQLNKSLEQKVLDRTQNLEETNIKLQESIEEIKTLQGIVPICASCKNIRDDSGFWNKIEDYIETHSLAEFSHGICPDCARKLYPDFVDKD